MNVPVATYRLQFNANFTFADAQALVPYLKGLGISDVYASPIFQARKGSAHGYDVVDPTTVSAELGGRSQLRALHETLEAAGMGWIQDIVPNHMAFDSSNPMLMDVLEYGARSTFFPFFDIDWAHPYHSLKNRVLAPFLEEPFGSMVEQGKIVLTYGQEGFKVRFGNQRFPLRVESYLTLLQTGFGEGTAPLEASTQATMDGLLSTLRNLSSDASERHQQMTMIKQMLWNLYQKEEGVRRHIAELLRYHNALGDAEHPCSELDGVLSDQLYRLSFWKVATEEINYRRFFTVNDLISIRVQDPTVFQATHALLAELLKEGTVTGVRVDHVDGLASPAQYLAQLQTLAADHYTIVEKVLQHWERLPATWACQGTTGYDFLFHLSNIFCDRQHEDALTAIHEEFTSKQYRYQDLLIANKRLIVEKHMLGDVENLALSIRDIASRSRKGSDLTLPSMRKALVEYIARLPCYRTYVDDLPLSEEDVKVIEDTVEEVIIRYPDLKHEASFLRQLLFLQHPASCPDEDQQQWLAPVRRLQQTTAAVFAKGMEDTVLYIDNRLCSLNEVGGNPSVFGIPLERFHAFNTERATYWPLALSATATHDTKRGEDVRARISVLSEMPQQWRDAVFRWRDLNKAKKTPVDGRLAPSPNEEYAFYQALVGTLPFSEHIDDEYVSRHVQYAVKAVREAERHTAWLAPNTAYEEALKQFIIQVLGDPAFLDAFLPFQRDVARYAILSSLAQVLIKATAPGVPDFYQGTELWDLSLVDPDNRRPVDFAARKERLRLLREHEGTREQLLKELLTKRANGDVKLFTMITALRLRSLHPDLFSKGGYLPIIATGDKARHVVAFARTWEGTWSLTVAPRFVAGLCPSDGLPVGRSVWGTTAVPLPSAAPRTWTNAFTEETLTSPQTIPLYSILGDFPLGLLIGREPHAK